MRNVIEITAFLINVNRADAEAGTYHKVSEPGWLEGLSITPLTLCAEGSATTVEEGSFEFVMPVPITRAFFDVHQVSIQALIDDELWANQVTDVYLSELTTELVYRESRRRRRLAGGGEVVYTAEGESLTTEVVNEANARVDGAIARLEAVGLWVCEDAEEWCPDAHMDSLTDLGSI